MSGFKVEQLDHVHIYVADQYVAAEWYQKILGLEIVEEVEDWATDGPLTISSDGGSTSLALFNAGARGFDGPRRSTVAFRVKGGAFLDFLDRLEAVEVDGGDGRPLARADVVDHEHSLSVYFKDPDGNPYELTTYDHALVRERLRDEG
ncbi:MAG TPA: VOC family protein [Pyrinomonadaceae bacterium]|nr:VOC family protein [Pyrinomonadaceae bacterium]